MHGTRCRHRTHTSCQPDVCLVEIQRMRRVVRGRHRSQTYHHQHGEHQSSVAALRSSSDARRASIERHQGRSAVRRARHRRRHHRRGSPSTRPSGLRAALIERDDFASRHIVEVARSWSTAACAIYSTASPPRLRSPARAPAADAQRPAPRRGVAVPAPDHDQGQRGLAQDRQGPRFGTVDVRPDGWLADRQAPSPVVGRAGCGSLPVDPPRQAGGHTCTTTRPPTTPA